MRALLLIALVGCTRPAESRAPLELDIGRDSLRDVSVEVAGGLAAIRKLGDHELELWSQSPVLDITLNSAGGTWTITARNILTDAVLTANGVTHVRNADQFPTVGVFQLDLAPGTHQLHIAPPDEATGTFRVCAMADIQTALPEVHEVFERINAVPNARFVVAMGDITQRSLIEEYDLFDRQLQTLRIPFYTTLGNHELWADPTRYFDRYGRASFQFAFKGTAFTFVDSGDAGIEPLVEDWLDGWLDEAKDQPHVLLTHFPPIDPVGIRYGGFRSGDDARRLLTRLVRGNVDLTLYGHIHTYAEFENAGIPAFISGGGGAEPMKWDGIDRHFLVIDFDGTGVTNVSVQRVD